MAAFLHEGGLKLRQKVRAVIVNAVGQFLLVRPHGYREGEWSLAGGGVESGETPHQAMRREIAEELGVALEEDLEQLPIGNRFIYTAEHKARRGLDHDGQEATMFVVRLPVDVPLSLQAEEIVEARWFEREEALRAFPVKKQREIFEQCLRKLATERL
ncbi:MAG: hypothetical protein CVT74_00960 [Alphaproteobacteria bacterium HGW-Alphaproteobacteria-13]|nr:MAG: hypothetical protein CVT74_00960 [Alphaproteobacteria bacterium HGW-Alphaproteobacteria-13]